MSVLPESGDGELDEGQNWEAAAAAAKFQLENLTLIVDCNHYQQTGAAEALLEKYGLTAGKIAEAARSVRSLPRASRLLPGPAAPSPSLS